MLKPHVLHNLCLQMSRNILKIPTSLIHASKTHTFISSPCVTRHGHVFLPFGVILTKYASVSQLNKSICSNICPGPPSVNTKACIFVRRQMSTTWRFPKTSPNPANSDNDKQAPPLLAQSTHGPRFWSSKVEDFFWQGLSLFFAAQFWLSEYSQSVNVVCPDCHLEQW